MKKKQPKQRPNQKIQRVRKNAKWDHNLRSVMRFPTPPPRTLAELNAIGGKEWSKLQIAKVFGIPSKLL